MMVPPDAAAAIAPETGFLPGCRLRKLEVYNWGTFDRRIWSFDVEGRNALLTGDIGSGKSTLVDAVTTLLLPAHKISYNKAAGARAAERDLHSYVVGHYRSQRNETTGVSRPVGLRDCTHYSVILGVFADPDHGDTVTLAQAFRALDAEQGQPERLFFVADFELSIAKHFVDFGTELSGLKPKLRESGVRCYKHFPGYGADVRRQLGLDSDQAMELFHQTVSMKAVDNLTDFVRSHMLEPFDTQSRIAALVEHFEDLTKAHDAVVRARSQLELLAPLVVDLDAYEMLEDAIASLGRQLRSLPYFFAGRTVALIDQDLADEARRLARLDHTIAEAREAVERLRQRDHELRLEIAGAGGDRLATIEEAIAECDRQRPRRRERFDRFNELLRAARLDEVSERDQFVATRERVEAREADLGAQTSTLEGRLMDQRDAQRTLDEEAADVNNELHSLRSRQTNIPSRTLELRAHLCADLSLDPEDLPFAGELLQVRDDAREWEGAAERVLRGFALSLLVPDAHYPDVASWINTHHLNDRIVYFRVPPRPAPSGPPQRRSAHPLLFDMIEIRPDTAFAPWLRVELARRADHVCVPSVDAFRSADKAVTRQGQIKDKNRHEKDDRRRIDDRRTYVLGWTNQYKIEALIAHAAELNNKLAKVRAAMGQFQSERTALAGQREDLVRLREYTSWDDLDWQSLVKRMASLGDEARRIRTSSDRLATLTDERDRVRAEITALGGHLDQRQEARGGIVERQRALNRDRQQLAAQLADEGALAAATPEFAAIDRLLGDLSLPNFDLSSASAVEQAVGTELTDRREGRIGDQARLRSRIERAMAAFRGGFPREAVELDDTLASGPEYRALHARVAADDLPRFEREFKDYLNQNTIREIAAFAAQLSKQEKTIEDRVGTINASLQAIDYNPDRYIRLLPDRSPNDEIRRFREQLRACTDNVVGVDEADHYSEARFLRVKAIVDRFKGSQAGIDGDRKWTRLVTDVRQWFTFSASERWRHDDREHETYSDSDGKSGGQKEKLAYTILAASLAYQFKLDQWASTRSRSFRFVVIDEAFGRGSDESTRYALKLFDRLGLQLLIVTPLQKLHVIEPYVACLGFVDNLNGDYSRLRRITIEEHRRHRQELSATP